MALALTRPLGAWSHEGFKSKALWCSDDDDDDDGDCGVEMMMMATTFKHLNSTPS